MKCGVYGFEELKGEDFFQVLATVPMAGILESLANMNDKGVRHHVDLLACLKCETAPLKKSLAKAGLF